MTRETREVTAVGATLLIAVLGMGTFTHQAVSGVRDDVTVLRGEMAIMRGEMADVRGEVTDLRSEVADFRERMTRAVGDLGARLARLEGAMGASPQSEGAGG